MRCVHRHAHCAQAPVEPLRLVPYIAVLAMFGTDYSYQFCPLLNYYDAFLITLDMLDL